MVDLYVRSFAKIDDVKMEYRHGIHPQYKTFVFTSKLGITILASQKVLTSPGEYFVEKKLKTTVSFFHPIT